MGTKSAAACSKSSRTSPEQLSTSAQVLKEIVPLTASRCRRRALRVRPPRTRWRGLAAHADQRSASWRSFSVMPHEGIAFNEHYTGDGAIIYKHACALGCEGIVSKRLGSPYRSGRAD